MAAGRVTDISKELFTCGIIQCRITLDSDSKTWRHSLKTNLHKPYYTSKTLERFVQVKRESKTWEKKGLWK